MSRLLVLYALLTSVAAPPPAKPPSCGLYDDSPVGVVCFRGDEMASAIATGGTSWLVEFYSSWCGHCQYFAPTWKKLAEGISGWSPVVQLGVIDCSAKESYSTCTDYNIRGYPMMRFFHPGEGDPNTPAKSYTGSRKIPDLEAAILDHVQSYEGPPLPHWPHFSPLEGGHLLMIPEKEWAPVAVVFEEEDSIVGRKLMLDLVSLQQLQVYRALSDNAALVNHYSVMEFPSLVIEIKKDDYVVVPGHSLDDPRQKFGESVQMHFRNVSLHAHPSATRPPLLPGAGVLQDTSSPHTTPLGINRVNPLDLLGAVSYILRKEVPLHSTVSGTAFTVLLRLTHLLENVFTKAYPAAALSLSQVRERLETRLSAGFITNRDWSRLLNTKLNESLFPLNPDWHHCRGSQSHFRGYPCSLWSLAHTLTVLTLPVQPGTDSSASLSLSPGMTFRSKDALNIFSRFVQNFFSCDYCREHFTEMARTLEEGKVLHDGDAVLWLWEAHNTVSRRLVKDISSDPLYPKLPFPSVRHCPYCYKQIYSSDVQGRVAVARPNWINTGFRSRAESFLKHNVTAGNLRYVWNRTAVLLYLWNFYHWNDTHTISQKEILQAAWPRLFVPQQQAYRPTQQGIGFSTYDLGLCVSYYIVCGTLLLVVGYWLIRRRLRHRRHFLHP